MESQRSLCKSRSTTRHRPNSQAKSNAVLKLEFVNVASEIVFDQGPRDRGRGGGEFSLRIKYREDGEVIEWRGMWGREEERDSVVKSGIWKR